MSPVVRMITSMGGGGAEEAGNVCVSVVGITVSEDTTALYREETGGPGAQVCLGSVPRGMRLCGGAKR